MGYYYRGQLGVATQMVREQFFPCQSTIYYSLGEFDTRFGITEQEFLKYVKEAEDKWDAAAGRELFAYKDGASFQLNLVYDNRQAVTDTLDMLGDGLDQSRTAYNELKSKYESVLEGYRLAKQEFESKVDAFEKANAEYAKEVKYWNAQGGADPEKYKELSAIQSGLEADNQSIQSMQNALNAQVAVVNKLVHELNSVAKDLNLNVAKYNEVGQSNGAEFEEGKYYQGPNGRWIDVYQYEDATKLRRVLAHEFGHVLGIDHVEDPDAIMYFLNESNNLNLTNADVLAMEEVCKIGAEK